MTVQQKREFGLARPLPAAPCMSRAASLRKAPEQERGHGDGGRAAPPHERMRTSSKVSTGMDERVHEADAAAYSTERSAMLAMLTRQPFFAFRSSSLRSR
ncbi:hypothetical protein PR003_g12685 [Phytophthora rubi]|uniref:Uncharacterized protein n=1 Tax=Phytophthora rubi TaxID=129364 RepID=A0A6A3MBZ5_9STRA|nr:hypothetical protein PR002_g11944 [Phytophthora rubi]KAE9029052.1 hypothetical protein PR001_g11598 [Phytophthora rubi]KAE9336088.1 hypothetical protein PR003_g12685 [Phytophthora rubi]